GFLSFGLAHASSLISALRLTSKRAMAGILPRSTISAALLAGALAVLLPASWARAQTAPDGGLQISWEVRNRFRLFREERDFVLTGAIPVGATCAWWFDDGDGPQQSTFDCAEPVNLRVRYGRTTAATVDVSSGSDGSQRISTEIAVRDIFIAGLGDSVASGE